MVKSKKRVWRVTLANTAEKQIFKYVKDCSRGKGNKFLVSIVLMGLGDNF